MIQKLFIAFMIHIFVGSLFFLYADKKPIGKITRIQGGTYAEGKTYSRELRTGYKLYEGEVIVTGKDARIQLEFDDQSTLILGENTRFVLEKYEYKPAKKTGRSFFQLIQGVFGAVTGKIAKMRGNPYQIQTPVAIIGVKGTRFWGGFWKTGKFDVALLEGEEVIVSNKKGTVRLTRPNDGTTLESANTAPTEPKAWGQKKLEKAIATITFRKKRKKPSQ